MLIFLIREDRTLKLTRALNSPCFYKYIIVLFLWRLQMKKILGYILVLPGILLVFSIPFMLIYTGFHDNFWLPAMGFFGIILIVGGYEIGKSILEKDDI